MSKVIINAKGSAELKEAIRLVAQDESKTRTVSSSEFIIAVLEQDPRVKAKLASMGKTAQPAPAPKPATEKKAAAKPKAEKKAAVKPAAKAATETKPVTEKKKPGRKPGSTNKKK